MINSTKVKNKFYVVGKLASGKPSEIVELLYTQCVNRFSRFIRKRGAALFKECFDRGQKNLSLH